MKTLAQPDVITVLMDLRNWIHFLNLRNENYSVVYEVINC